MRLYVIPAGRLRIDKGAVFTPGIDEGVHIEVPVPIYLIHTDQNENVLVDTGLHPANVDNPYHTWGEDAAEIVLPILTPADLLEPRLAEIRAIVAPGHARGLQALLVALPNTRGILIASDAPYTAEHLERDLSTHCPDPETARQTAHDLQRIAAEHDALLLYGHDIDQW